MISSTNLTALTIVNSFSLYRMEFSPLSETVRPRWIEGPLTNRQRGTLSRPALPTSVNSLSFPSHRSRHPLLLAANGSSKRGPLRSSALLVPAVTYRRTSVPEAKEEEQEQKVVLSWPSSSATTTVVVANGDPPFRKVMGLAVRSKVVCHCCGADRFTTSAPLSNIAGLASICRI
ncbi:hypothetical protein IEQ34_024821 [Dendrobium chrysotoxum]|uniref:Uncharacterized protein n=1 Tax=Dendrobium chrysotoxum TaxID=161865 RepID=A0AAV7FR61_DENCH|nr:hypothetical protein IEQ34_024821 [Dendrobium chrysotoxum]